MILGSEGAAAPYKRGYSSALPHLPAAALKIPPSRVSRLQALNDCFRNRALHSRRIGNVALPPYSSIPTVLRTAGMGDNSTHSGLHALVAQSRRQRTQAVSNAAGSNRPKAVTRSRLPRRRPCLHPTLTTAGKVGPPSVRPGCPLSWFTLPAFCSGRDSGTTVVARVSCPFTCE